MCQKTSFKKKVKFGKNVLVGKNVKIGKNCSIGHNSIIEKNVIIGDNCSIGSNVIVRNTIIKDNVNILDGCVIGKRGFGFFPNKDKNVRYPIKIKYNINDLGKDRLAAIIGAINLYTNKNILILDIGTCLTIDLVNNNKHSGGRISPGLDMRYKALNKFTAKLPLCEKSSKNLKYGNSTISSIQSGVQNGMIDEIDTLITEFKQENKNNIVIATGGDCFFFEKELKNSIFADQFLVLRGLNEILDFNV